MMLKSQLKLSLAGVFVMACVAWLGFANGHPTGEQELQVLEYKDDKYIYRVPVAMKGVFSEARRNAECNGLERVLSTLNSPIRKIFINHSLTISLASDLASITRAAGSMLFSLKNVQKKDKTAPKVPDGYVNEMADLLLAIERGDKKAEPITDQEALDRANRTLKAVNELCNQSPVGLALDWPKLTVSGTTLDQFVAPIINYLAAKKYKSVLWTMRQIANALKSQYG